MNIQLTSTKTLFLKLQPPQDNFIEQEEKFSFDYQVEFPESIKNKFIVVIKSLIEHKSGYHIDTIFLAEFKIDSDINEEFKNSKFPFVITARNRTQGKGKEPGRRNSRFHLRCKPGHGLLVRQAGADQPRQ